MSDLPFWGYGAMTFGALAFCGAIAMLLATSKRNNPPKRETVSVVAEDGQVIGTGTMRRRGFAEVTLEALEVIEQDGKQRIVRTSKRSGLTTELAKSDNGGNI